MKLHYKNQQFQLDAVNAVTDVFKGQQKQNSLSYMMDLGNDNNIFLDIPNGFKNMNIGLSNNDLLQNIKSIQKDNGLVVDDKLAKMKIGGKDKKTKVDNYSECLTLTVEMETGTGKTYTYIKTMFELHKQYGWSKFIIVVPSIAIREGIAKTFESTTDHFKTEYGISIRSFIYNSSQLDKIEAFASDPGINVMIINTQAFNARGANARRIDMVLDQFRGRRPIDVISATNPIMIIDEPQSVLGGTSKAKLNATRIGLAKFNPLFFINYSATHREKYNMVYRLDAVDAYQKKLVKKIAVKGIEIDGSNAASGYLYLEAIIEKPDLKARIQFEKISPKTGKVEQYPKLFDKGDNLYTESGEIESYHSGYTISEINATDQFIEFTNGIKLKVGNIVGDINDDNLRRIQIRETIKSHLNKEASLFKRGIKTLSLFFIDKVDKYKDYKAKDNKGIYANVFEKEYKNIIEERLKNSSLDKRYREYLERELSNPEKVHAGYFSIDKKGKSIDGNVNRNKLSEDISAYDLIMKDKERLLSFDEPVRFIFSHSALKEGWDNPNVFQIATLSHSSSDIKKRQEIGRGLRLSVNQNGDRQDEQTLGEAEVQQVNVLTVIANESYESFAKELQDEMAEAVKNRPKFIEPKLFEGRILINKDDDEKILDQITVDNANAAEIYTSLKSANIITKSKQADNNYKMMSTEEQIITIKAALSDEYQPFALPIQKLINSVYDPKDFPIENESKRTTLKLDKEKYASVAFKDLWSKINHKSYYTVDFDDQEIIDKSIREINEYLTVVTLKAKITEGTMHVNDINTVFSVDSKHSSIIEDAVNPNKYDLIGEVAEKVGLLRKTVGQILAKIDPKQFAKYKVNPENFIIQISNIINNIKAHNIVSHIVYNKLNEVWDEDAIFVDNDIQGIMGQNIFEAKKHLYDKVRVDSKVERRFANELDVQQNVEMYVKLPGSFYINTPVGKYNPDWAIVLNETNKKHIYFIAETKGVSDNIKVTLKGIEADKIDLAKQHFRIISDSEVTYDVVDSYDKMMDKLLSNN